MSKTLKHSITQLKCYVEEADAYFTPPGYPAYVVSDLGYGEQNVTWAGDHP